MSDYKNTQEHLAKYRGVHTYRGQRVIFDGQPSVVTDLRAGELYIRLDGEKHSYPVHPEWRMVYLDKPAKKSKR